MKTVIYQVPVSPVERNINKDNKEIVFTKLLTSINNQAYHMANRAATVLLGYLYPDYHTELKEILSAHTHVSDAEIKIKESHAAKKGSSSPAVPIEILIQDKRNAQQTWEDKIRNASFFKLLTSQMLEEFKTLPGPLLKEILHKVFLDFAYTCMNRQEQNNFNASFAFYKHEMHLPLCYDGNKIKWTKNEQQYILKWFNNINLQTHFTDQDIRLPKMLQQLYFTQTAENARGRKLHHYLQPTLKIAGAKWSIHIPVLEEVIPIPVEQNEPMHIVFGYKYPIFYALGRNHAKGLPIDTAGYINRQMLQFEKRKQKARENNQEKKILQIDAAKRKYIERLQAKAVKAILKLAKNSYKTKIVIEKWPVQKEAQLQQPASMKHSNFPDLYTRYLANIDGWDFDSFYEDLKNAVKEYRIDVVLNQKQSWNDFKLYARELSYPKKDENGKTLRRNNKVIKGTQYFNSMLIPNEYISEDRNMKLKGGFLYFIFSMLYYDTQGGFRKYDEIKGKNMKYLYRIHIDMNLAMNAAHDYYNTNNF